MEGSQVNSVSVDAATGAARVSATFREAVVAHRGAFDPVQAYRQGPPTSLPLGQVSGMLLGRLPTGVRAVLEAAVHDVLAALPASVDEGSSGVPTTRWPCALPTLQERVHC